MQDVKVTKVCEGCRQPMHLVMENSGSMWMHDKLADEQRCWDTYRHLYERGEL